MKKIFYILVSYLTFLLFFDSKVYADTGSTINVQSPTKLLPKINESKPGEGIANFITSMIGFAAILSIIAITVAAIMMIVSVGQEDKFKKAQKIAIYAIVGFAISAGAYLIVNVVTRLDFSEATSLIF